MKKIKVLTAVILAFVLMFSLTGCGEVQKAESAVNGMFEALKSSNFEEAQKYVNVEDITSAGESDMTKDSEVITNTVLKNLSYEIISSEKTDNNTVIVKTKITTTDMKSVMGEFFAKAFEYSMASVFTYPEITEEEQNAKMNEILEECVSKSDIGTVTNEVDIKVVKNDKNEWKVESDEAFVNALLGGLVEAIEDMQESFKGLE